VRLFKLKEEAFGFACQKSPFVSLTVDPEPLSEEAIEPAEDTTESNAECIAPNFSALAAFLPDSSTYLL
jgi:hypothetical protein